MANITFITPLNVIDKFGADEIAQRADSESATPVTGAELRTTIEDGDRLSWTAALIQQADDAEARVQSACDVANGLLTGAIRSAGCNDLVATSVPEDAKFYALSIARYDLYDDNYPEYVRVAFDDAKSWLDKVARRLITVDIGSTECAQRKSFVMIDMEFPLMNTDQSFIGF